MKPAFFQIRNSMIFELLEQAVSLYRIYLHPPEEIPLLGKLIIVVAEWAKVPPFYSSRRTKVPGSNPACRCKMQNIMTKCFTSFCLFFLNNPDLDTIFSL